MSKSKLTRPDLLNSSLQEDGFIYLPSGLGALQSDFLGEQLVSGSGARDGPRRYHGRRHFPHRCPCRRYHRHIPETSETQCSSPRAGDGVIQRLSGEVGSALPRSEETCDAGDGPPQGQGAACSEHMWRIRHHRRLVRPVAMQKAGPALQVLAVGDLAYMVAA